MILVDDILAAPGKGLMWVFRSIHRAVEDELAQEKTNLRSSLSDLYLQLERGEITDEEFDRQERSVLNRLEQIEGKGQEPTGGPEG